MNTCYEKVEQKIEELQDLEVTFVSLVNTV